MIGLFNSIYSILKYLGSLFWPSIPIVVKDKLGTAFGVVSSFENLNLTVSPVIFGCIHDYTKNIRGNY